MVPAIREILAKKIILFLIDFFVVVPVLSIQLIFLIKYKWNCDYLFQQTDSSTLPIPTIIYALVLKFHTDRRYKQLKGWFVAVVYNFLHRLTPLLWFDQINAWSQLELKGKIYKLPEALVAHGFSFAVIESAGVLSF